jgi:hypothetical protein
MATGSEGDARRSSGPGREQRRGLPVTTYCWDRIQSVVAALVP